MGRCSSRIASSRRSRPYLAAQTGDTYQELLAEGLRHASKEDWRKAAKDCRKAIALKPDEPVAYFNLGNALNSSGHKVEAAQRYLEAKERVPVGSDRWGQTTAAAFDLLQLPECAEVAKPVGVVERRGAQGAVGEGREGGTKR